MSTERLVRKSYVQVHQHHVVSRRDVLRWIPAASLAGLFSWQDLLASQAESLRRRNKACILLWMQGGPSQFETFSPLPRHPHGGGTKALATSVPGIQIAENLPAMSQMMHEVCLIRSVTSKEGSHPRASYLLHTGYLPNPSVRHPAFGAHVAHQMRDTDCELPAVVRIGQPARDGTGGGILGTNYDPFQVLDPDSPPQNTSPRTEASRYHRRLKLAEMLDQHQARRGLEFEAADHQRRVQRAAKMIHSPQMQAFDLSREPERNRRRYGDSKFAQGCLLARRLVEAGVPFVEVSLGNWDTHQDNFSGSKRLCQQLDQPFAHLIQDLRQRGRLDDTLIIWMGEFGRTPWINPRGGRDHFPRAFSVVLAGAGVQGGQVIGATDPAGIAIEDQPVTVPDLFRTFCAALQLDADQEHISSSGRPIKIVEEGQVVPGVLNTT